jgi:hypothetical protein
LGLSPSTEYRIKEIGEPTSTAEKVIHVYIDALIPTTPTG